MLNSLHWNFFQVKYLTGRQCEAYLGECSEKKNYRFPDNDMVIYSVQQWLRQVWVREEHYLALKAWRLDTEEKLSSVNASTIRFFGFD